MPVDLLDVIRGAARRAAEAARKVEEEGLRAKPVGRGEGGDTSLLADREAERAAIEYIVSKVGSAKIVSEEIGERVYGDEPQYVFVIDPIDGSRNYKRGVPLYAVSIAAGAGETFEDLEAAVVYAPGLNAEYYASRGVAAWLNGAAIRVSGRKTLAGAVVGMSTTPKARFIPQVVALRLAEEGVVLRSWGSISLELSYLASGGLDGYIEAWGTARVVDVAAAYLIALEAGATVRVRGRYSRAPRLSLSERLAIVAAATEELADSLEKAYSEALGWRPLEVFEVAAVDGLR